MFTHALEDLHKKGAIDLRNRYESLRKYDVSADFLFIVMRQHFNLDSDSPISEGLSYSTFTPSCSDEEPPEQYLGIDRNSLLVEYIALR
jgi:hypothetical protein